MTINSVKFEFLRMAIEEGYRDPIQTMRDWYAAILEHDVEEEPLDTQPIGHTIGQDTEMERSCHCPDCEECGRSYSLIQTLVVLNVVFWSIVISVGAFIWSIM